MFSRTAIHAIRALGHLALLPEGTYAGAWELAEQIDAPRNYLGKLLQNLAVTGLVESRKGAGGGWRLSRSPEKITLLDVVDPTDHVVELKRCILGQDHCSNESPCALHPRWAKVRNVYIEMLTSTTIAEIARGEASTEAKKS
jgi:Rrf2 family protein